MVLSKLFVRTEEGLTGRRRYRRGWFGKVILQVEVRIHSHKAGIPTRGIRAEEWRDATLAEVGLHHPHAHPGMQYQDVTTHFFARWLPEGICEVSDERKE